MPNIQYKILEIKIDIYINDLITCTNFVTATAADAERLCKIIINTKI